MLTENQKQQIRFMRFKGIGYRAIASDLGLSRDAVRSFCIKNNLKGLGTEIMLGESSIEFEYKICLYCGKELIQNKVGAKKKYCDIVCKRAYEKTHPKIHAFICHYCNKHFEAAGSKERKYCSNGCYVKDRFWRNEDTVKMIESIKKQKKISKMPKWFKEMIFELMEVD